MILSISRNPEVTAMSELRYSHLCFSLAIHRKLISLRDLEKECRYDIRFCAILNGDIPSYKIFERFINEDLCVDIEELL